MAEALILLLSFGVDLCVGRRRKVVDDNEEVDDNNRFFYSGVTYSPAQKETFFRERDTVTYIIIAVVGMIALVALAYRCKREAFCHVYRHDLHTRLGRLKLRHSRKSSTDSLEEDTANQETAVSTDDSLTRNASVKVLGIEDARKPTAHVPACHKKH